MCKLYKLTISTIIIYSVGILIFTGCNRSQVLTGLDILENNHFEPLKGKRVGIICNHSSLNHKGTHIVDLIAGSGCCKVKAIFAPEHGFRGDISAGKAVEDSIDTRTRVRIYSLYGRIKKPTTDMLDSIDILIYDVQDVGARFYTYISTLKYAMESACENGIDFMVLDRPNPIRGDIIQGPILERGFESFVGSLNIPIRYGLTPGEIALYINRYHLDGKLNLTVVPMKGWKRNMWYDQTGLKFVKPSPNIPDIETATLYPGFCLFEGTNISEGRGTLSPFKIIGAPWINGDTLLISLSKKTIRGVAFQSVKFTPMSIEGMAEHPKYLGKTCGGIKIAVTDREAFDPIKSAIILLKEIRILYPNRFMWKENWIDKLYGSGELREAIDSGKPLSVLFDSWEKEIKEYRKKIKSCLLYK